MNSCATNPDQYLMGGEITIQGTIASARLLPLPAESCLCLHLDKAVNPGAQFRFAGTSEDPFKSVPAGFSYYKIPKATAGEQALEMKIIFQQEAQIAWGVSKSSSKNPVVAKLSGIMGAGRIWLPLPYPSMDPKKLGLGFSPANPTPPKLRYRTSPWGPWQPVLPATEVLVKNSVEIDFYLDKPITFGWVFNMPEKQVDWDEIFNGWTAAAAE